MPDSLIAKARPLLELPAMSEAAVKNASKALVPVRVWVVAMIKYHETLKVVNPLREIAKQKGEELAIVEAKLATK